MIQAKEGYRIFKENYKWNKPIRSLGIRGSDLVNENYCEQLDFLLMLILESVCKR